MTDHKFDPFRMPLVASRKFTVGTEAFEFGEVQSTMLRMCCDSVAQIIANEHGDPTGDYQVQWSLPYEYDTVDDETGEPVHVGPLVDILVERAYWPPALSKAIPTEIINIDELVTSDNCGEEDCEIEGLHWHDEIQSFETARAVFKHPGFLTGERRKVEINKIADAMEVPREVVDVERPALTGDGRLRWETRARGFGKSAELARRVAEGQAAAEARGEIPKQKVVGHIEDTFDTIAGRVIPGFSKDLKPVEIVAPAIADVAPVNPICGVRGCIGCSDPRQPAEGQHRREFDIPGGQS